MEISTGADPYEQQLLAVFESCDRAGTGRLDSEGLAILCQKLHLQEGHDQLKGCLLRSGSGTKAVFTFTEFRDALLALLGAGWRQTEDIEDEREQSPDREVSPKFVFGQKKYGRRSRPESTDQDSGGQDTVVDDADCDTFLPPITNDNDYKIKCGSILEEEHKLRRSTVSTPDSVASIIIDKDEMESSHGQGEAELRAAWKRLGVGSDGFLDKLELAMVCRAVGMEKVAEEVINQVFSKLDLDHKGRISFEEFLQLFRSGTPQSPSHPVVSSPPPQPFQSSHLASLDINSTGYVSTDSIIELWEMAGVVGASGLLHDLGMPGSTEVNITLLASVLDEEIRNIRQDTKVHPNCSSHVALLTAALALAHVQIKCSKSSLEHMIGERDKLRNDLAEANERASLLAQEIDDRHARMEKASQMQIKVMEQRHAEQLKQLSLQLTADREQLTASTQRLEKKLAQQQEEESRIRADLATLQMEYETLEKDNRSLADRLSGCEELKARAEKEIQRMEKLQQRVSELEGSSDQVASLIESLTQLQAENASLRDRNDELTIQVETLTSRVSNRKQGSSISLEGCLGGGTKRRGNSPLALPPDENWDDDSPRMGKVRRCCTENDLSLDNVHMEGLAIRPLRHSESGLEADLDTLDDSLTLSNSSVDKVNFKVGVDSVNGGLIAEVERLRSYVAELERTNEQYQMKLAVCDYQYSTSDEDDSENARCKVKHELKQVFSVIRKQVMDELCGQIDDDADRRTEDNTVVSIPQTEAVEMEIQTSIENSDDVTDLKNQCSHLKMTLNQVHKELKKLVATNKICTDDCIMKHHYKM